MPALSVVMSGRLAGSATVDGAGASTRVGFVYDLDYLHSPAPTPLSVSVPLEPGRHEIGAWMEGLLSDNPAVRDRWQVEHQTPTTRAVDLLASPVGRDCPGAVQFCPTEDTDAMLARSGGLRKLSERRVATMIARLRKDEAAWSLGDGDAAFSLGGAQAKTALRHDQGQWLLPYGASPTTHILKPGVARFPDTDIIEHISQRAASLLGIDAAETQCVSVGGQRALLVTRYDRLPVGAGEYRRIHQEDVGQALGVPSARKYQRDGGPNVAEVAGLLWASSSHPETDVRLFRDALIYNWLIVGTDAHTKNYGLLLDGHEARLAPLYDVCSILPYRDEIARGKVMGVRQLKLAMKIGRDYTIHKADYRRAWERTSKALGLPSEETLSRAEDLSQRVPSATGQAIDEMPPGMRSSRYVARLQKEVEQRARHCAFVRHMHAPSRYAKVASAGGSAPSLQTNAESPADRPSTRQRCSHIGERSNVRCVLSAGHKTSHRYQ